MYVFMYVYIHAYIHSQAIHIAIWPSSYNYTYICIYVAIMCILGNTHSAMIWLSLTTENQNKDHHLASGGESYRKQGDTLILLN